MFFSNLIRVSRPTFLPPTPPTEPAISCVRQQDYIPPPRHEPRPRPSSNGLSELVLLRVVENRMAAPTRAAPGIEPGTSRTLSENHATRPSSQMHSLNTGAHCAECIHPVALVPPPSRRSETAALRSCKRLLGQCTPLQDASPSLILAIIYSRRDSNPQSPP